MIQIALILSLAISTCVASVDFTYSTLYDINDFVGKDEVFLPKCDNGCVIYASTMGCGFVDSPSNYDPYAENLIIQGGKPDQDISITDLSRKYDDKTFQKTPLTITGISRISVRNLNTATDTPWPIALYVVEKSKADGVAYSMYDALNLKELSVTNFGKVTTVLSAQPFALTAANSGSPNGVSTRLAGFDNAFVGNSDDCSEAFSMPTANPFPGFILNINGPLISLVFTEQTTVQLDASIQFIPLFDFAQDGFITSAGYSGCKKSHSGEVQTFRSSFLEPSDIYQLSSQNDLYRVSIEVEPSLDAAHKVTINDITNFNKLYSVTGYDEVDITLEKTDFVNIVFNGLKDDQAFLLRYTSQMIPRTTTTANSAASTSIVDSTRTTSAATQTPTTSGSYAVQSALISISAVCSILRLA